MPVCQRCGRIWWKSTLQKVTNKDEEALQKMREDISTKAAEEEINTKKYILGIED